MSAARQSRRENAFRSKHLSARAAWVGPVTWAIGLALFVVAAGSLPTVRDLASSRPTSATLVHVAAADTLWSIAARHRVPGVSTADTVESIAAVNGLERRTVVAGTSLKVPTVGISDAALARSAEAVAAR